MGSSSAAATSPPASSARSTIVQVIVTMLATLVVLIAAAAVGLVLIHHQISMLTTTVTPATTANRTIRQGMTDSDAAIRNFQLTGNRDLLAPYAQVQQPLADALATLDVLSHRDAGLEGLVDRQHRAATVWLTQYAAPAARGQGESEAMQSLANAAFDNYRQANVAVGDALRARNNALIARSTLLIWVSLGVLTTLAAIGVLLVLAPALRMLRLIGPPLESLQLTVGRLRGGDLTSRVDPTLGVVEIQAVSSALNELAAEIGSRRQRDAVDLRLASSVRDLSVRIGSTLDLHQIATTSARGLSEHFGADAAWVRIFGETGPNAEPGVGVRYPDTPGLAASEELRKVARRMALLAWSRQTAHLFSRGVATDADYLTAEESRAVFATTTHADSQHILFVPIGVGPQCLGYAGLSRPGSSPRWSEPEIDALVGLGRDLGRATLHAHLFARESYLVTELKEIDSRKNDFVSMVSHELRTPLASIIGHLEIVRSGELGVVDVDMEPSLGAIDRNAVRLTTLIEDLLLLSRIEQRAQPAKLHPLDLAAVAEDVVALHADPAGQKDIAVVLIGDTQAPVLGDELELERVLSNLISNAIKYSAAGSTVRVEITAADDDVVAAVHDEGIGLSDRDLGQLFQRFFRSSNPRAQAVPGTGLGLAITKLIVEKHSGSVLVDSTLGSGSTFTVRLPRLVGPEATRARQPLAAQVG